MATVETDASSAETFLERLTGVMHRTTLAEMAGGVAHELNQPLAAIATYAHAGERMLARDQPLVDGALDVFRKISDEALGAGERLKTIRRLFDQKWGQHRRCQLGTVLAELRPTLDRLASFSDSVVCVESGPRVPDVRVEVVMIQTVILTLVQNALDANADEHGDRAVTLDITADGYSVEMGVSDSGPGVSPEATERLFRPFFSTKPRGTGLGLTSSRAIIETHEGSMGFHHRIPRGARFWFRLPVAVA